ncbi:meiotic recombination protein DMC1/LIM15 homolog [Brevipalpus obovatus]|uniref:meiotic recombination protein DMC1/LIM15 homolog n=1 Tax=Brevipalpus obovatus TaxID=246614 RepID=UPI003D9DFD14
MSRLQAKRKHVEEEEEEESFVQDEAGEEDTFQEVDKLMEQGIPSGDLKKLKAAGIYTIKGIHMVLRKKLLQIKGLSEQKVDKIREAARKVMNIHQFRTGTAVEAKRRQIFRVKTGCTEFDLILGGGIESMSITEAYGEYRCGKTQLAHTLSVSCQMVEIDGEWKQIGKAIFLDTESTFRPDRLRKIAERFKESNMPEMAEIDPELAVENVLHIRVYNTDHQCEILDNAAEEICKDKDSGNKFRLIVVDSVMALFRVDFSGRGELADRQQKLAQFMSKLQRLCEEYNLAVYITNQMTADPGAMSFGPAMKPIGGHILAHASATRIHLRKAKGETRIAKICDSPDMPENEGSYTISVGGITDPTHQ